MAFAVIKTGGKQYRVAEGDVITVEKIKGADNAIFKEGDSVSFDEVLLMDDGSATTFGSPAIAGKAISGTIEKIGRGPKITVIHFKSKSNRHKINGHRQPYFKVKIGAF